MIGKSLHHLKVDINFATLRFVRPYPAHRRPRAQVTDGALQLGVPQQKLHGAEILGALVNQCGLGSAHGMRAIGGRIQPYGSYPTLYNTCLLPGGKWKDEVRRVSCWGRESGSGHSLMIDNYFAIIALQGRL